MDDSQEIKIDGIKMTPDTGCSCRCHCHSDNNNALCNEESETEKASWREFVAPAISFALLLAGLIIDHFHDDFLNSNSWAKPLWYFIAFLPVGVPVIKEAFEGIWHKDYFNELTLMSIACIGAFLIGEYSEAVGVMLFYCIGETLQNRAVARATRDISKLLDIRPEKARLIRDGHPVMIKPEEAQAGDIIEVHAGERVPLDGILESEEGTFDTAALTGESVPKEIEKDGEVLAGMISSDSTVRIKVTHLFGDSALSRILELVKNAQARKAKSEVFIRKFARIYTPVVTLLAVLVVVVPAIIGAISPSFHYNFTEWLYRALVFLVISCPCALVISIPLSYFAGIGVASRLGILFKGGNYLETITRVNAVAFDKTGTLTTGNFSVEKLSVVPGLSKEEFLRIIASAESESSHPLAKALVNYVEDNGIELSSNVIVHELAGKGTSAEIDGQKILAGNLKLMKENNVSYPEELDSNELTTIVCAINGKYAGYVVMADTVKDDSILAIQELHKLRVDDLIMLSGDRKAIVDNYAARIGITQAYGDLMPADKADIVEKIAKTPGKVIAFVGDGMNDAPVLSISNVGVAMGGLGSDAAIESADVVIQTDNPSRVATAIKIGKYTHKIVIQNIVGALAIKVVVLALGLDGIATLWAAVFADVGVTMLAVLNSMRIMWHKY